MLTQKSTSQTELTYYVTDINIQLKIITTVLQRSEF